LVDGIEHRVAVRPDVVPEREPTAAAVAALDRGVLIDDPDLFGGSGVGSLRATSEQEEEHRQRDTRPLLRWERRSRGTGSRERRSDMSPAPRVPMPPLRKVLRFAAALAALIEPFGPETVDDDGHRGRPSTRAAQHPREAARDTAESDRVIQEWNRVYE